MKLFLKIFLYCIASVLGDDATFSHTAFTCNVYNDLKDQTACSGTQLYTDTESWKIKTMTEMPPGVKLIQTPNSDVRSNFFTQAVVELDFMQKHTVYYLAVPTSSFRNDEAPGWIKKALWKSTKYSFTATNGVDTETYFLYSKAVKPDETLTLRALCDCDDTQPCPTNYVLLYKLFGKPEADNDEACVCHVWGDPHQISFSNTLLDVGGRWLDGVRTQDCSFRVQAYSLAHWGRNAITAFLTVQIGNSYYGFDYAGCQQLQDDPNYDLSKLETKHLNFVDRTTCTWWFGRDISKRRFLFFKNEDPNDKNTVIDVNNNGRRFIIKNEALGVEVEVDLEHKYWIRLKGQAMKERSGFGYCGECAGNDRLEHETESGVQCGLITMPTIERHNNNQRDQLREIFSVPSKQIIWDKFTKSKTTTGSERVSTPECHDHFCESATQEFVLGDAPVPTNENCLADTCQTPPTENHRAKSLNALKDRFPSVSDTEINEKYFEIVDQCYKATKSIGGHVGDDCMIDASIGMSPDSYDNDCSLPQTEPGPAQILQIPEGSYEYAVMPYTDKAATQPTCLNGANARPPIGWEVVPDDDSKIAAYLQDQGTSSPVFGSKCFYTVSNVISIGDDDCDKNHLVANTEQQCYELKSCHGMILLRRAKELTSCGNLMFKLRKGTEDLSGHILPHEVDEGWLGELEAVDEIDHTQDDLHNSLQVSCNNDIDLDHISKSLYPALLQIQGTSEYQSKTIAAVGLFRALRDGEEASIHVCGFVGIRNAEAGMKSQASNYPDLTTIDFDIHHSSTPHFMKWGARTLNVHYDDEYSDFISGYKHSAKFVFKKQDIGTNPQWSNYFRAWCASPADLRHVVDGEGLRVKFSNLKNIDQIVVLHYEKDSSTKLINFADTKNADPNTNYVLSIDPTPGSFELMQFIQSSISSATAPMMAVGCMIAAAMLVLSMVVFKQYAQTPTDHSMDYQVLY